MFQSHLDTNNPQRWQIRQNAKGGWRFNFNPIWIRLTHSTHFQRHQLDGYPATFQSHLDTTNPLHIVPVDYDERGAIEFQSHLWIRLTHCTEGVQFVHGVYDPVSIPIWIRLTHCTVGGAGQRRRRVLLFQSHLDTTNPLHSFDALVAERDALFQSHLDTTNPLHIS